MTDLSGKRALVTGAARGIGAAIAVELARRGADVAITFERSADKAAAVARAIEGEGRRATFIQADASDADATARAVNEAAKALGGLDILVNNAGVAASASLGEMPIEEIDRLLAVNVRGPVLAAKAAIPHLSDGGRIISIGSCLGERVPFPGVTVYSMSKSALLSFTRGLARELGPRGITVNLVQPGPTDTDMNPADGPRSDAMRAGTALGRYSDPADIAAAVAFLAGPGARQITGTTLTVDGGANA